MKKLHSSSIISILFILGILVMINIIGIRSFIRLDLTSSKMYSLSRASKNIVGEIEDKLIIKAYFSSDLPSPLNNVRRYLRDMLEDYRAYSKGHLEYEFIDPGSEEKLEKEAQSFRIPPRQYQTVESDKIEVKLGYTGVVFIYGDKKEVIPVLDNVSNLEYEITSLINRLTSQKLPILGMASSGTEEEKVTMQRLYEGLGRNFDVRPLDLNEPISEDFNGAFLIAPRQPLTDWQLFNLDQYIINGGKVAIFASSYEPFLQQQFASKRELNLNGFLNNYGIGINEDILIDNKSASVNIQRRQGFFQINQPVRLPYLPTLVTFNRGISITRDLNKIQTYFPSSVDTTLAANKGFESEGLLYTSDLSAREHGPSIRIDVMRRWTEDDFGEKHIPVAAVVKGKFSSYFAESGPPKKPNPDETVDEEGEGAAEEEGVEYDGPFTTTAVTENRLVVVGDGHMGLDEYSSGFELMFVQNIADWLVQAESLISIRSKQIPLKPLKNVGNFAKKIIKWANQLGPVIMVVILGIVLWQVRRFRKKVLMLQ